MYLLHFCSGCLDLRDLQNSDSRNFKSDAKLDLLSSGMTTSLSSTFHCPLKGPWQIYQLHCLVSSISYSRVQKQCSWPATKTMIRTALYNSSAPSHGLHLSRSDDTSITLSGHVWYCLDYLRQGIICSGDVTVEWAQVGPNGEHVQVDGWVSSESPEKLIGMLT